MRIPVHQLTPAADRREVAAHWQPVSAHDALQRERGSGLSDPSRRFLNFSVATIFVSCLAFGSSSWAEDLDDLAWLAGHWVSGGIDDTGDFEEVWLTPKGGTMAGSFRWVFPDGNQVLEYLIIEETVDAIYFRFKHFKTDYVTWEKETPNTYRMVELTDNKVVFDLVEENAKVPNHIYYLRDGNKLEFLGWNDKEEDTDALRLHFIRKKIR